MIKFVFIISFLFGHCCQCHDQYFEMRFKEVIKKLELLKSAGITSTNNIDSIKIASQVLSSLTGARPHISYNYTVTYSEKDFRIDSIKWNEWYQKNKCKVSKQLFDSIYQHILLNYKK